MGEGWGLEGLFKKRGVVFPEAAEGRRPMPAVGMAEKIAFSFSASLPNFLPEERGRQQKKNSERDKGRLVCVLMATT